MEKFNIFAGDLSFFCTEDDLVRLFSSFGEVQGAIIRRGKQGDTLHYGFVKMHDVDAKNAVSQLQGQYFMGRRVKLNLETGEDGPKAKGKQPSYPQVHVSFLSTSIRSQVNEDLLTRMFSRFGDVMDCVIKQYNLSVNPHRQSGYGFVYYRTEEEATGAIHAVKNSTIDGIKFDCGFSREYQPSHRAMASTISVPREERYASASLSASQQHSVAFGQEGLYSSGGGYFPPQSYALPSYYPPANRPLQPAATYQMGNIQPSGSSSYHSQPLFSMNFVHHAPQHYPTLLANNTSGGSPVSHSSSGGDPSQNSGSSPAYAASYGMQQPPAHQQQQPQSAPLPPMYPSSYATYPFPSSTTGQPPNSNRPYFSSQPYPFN